MSYDDYDHYDGYDDAMHDYYQQQAIDEAIEALHNDDIRSQIKEEYLKHKEIFGKINSELALLKQNPMLVNTCTLSCFAAIEMLVKKIVMGPMVEAIIGGNTTGAKNLNKTLQKILIHHLNYDEFVFEYVKKKGTELDRAHDIFKKIELLANIEPDGTSIRYVKSRHMPETVQKCYTNLRDVRNGFVHGSAVATKADSKFIFGLLIIMIDVINLILEEFDLKLDDKFVLHQKDPSPIEFGKPVQYTFSPV
jgi:hypothetical protein